MLAHWRDSGVPPAEAIERFLREYDADRMSAENALAAIGAILQIYGSGKDAATIRAEVKRQCLASAGKVEG